MIDLAQVGAWLGEPVVFEGAATTGSSSTTLFVRIGDLAAVLQHPPSGPTLPTAHDLARKIASCVPSVPVGRVPVPRVIAFCDDATVAGMPFLLTAPRRTCLMGDTTEAIDATPLARDAVDVLAELHAIDWSGLGLTAAPGSYLERQIIRWNDQLARTPTASRLGELSPLKEWLLAHRPPARSRSSCTAISASTICSFADHVTRCSTGSWRRSAIRWSI